MSIAVEAIYESGQLRLLEPLPLSDKARVRVTVDVLSEDAERSEWLAESGRRLEHVWANEADDVYNALLTE